ncbi:MAG TPA: hypothetical protein VL201_02400 [Patescibacteria group bacterium]|jgi:hypothetical protein|nr:hypothetical protein [Patescibacteria group bacterium]
MKKINFYNIFAIISMLSVTHTTAPIFTMAFFKDTHRIITRTANIGSWLATFGWAVYIGAHYTQLKKVHALHDKCAKSPESTLEEHKKSLYHIAPLTGTFFYKQAILECMKNKNENLKNFNECLDLVDKLTGKE